MTNNKIVILLIVIYLLGVITGYYINNAQQEKIKYEKEIKYNLNKTFNVSQWDNITVIKTPYEIRR